MQGSNPPDDVGLKGSHQETHIPEIATIGASTATAKTAQGHSQQHDTGVSSQQLPALGQQHATKKRWRHGKMDEELADMRQRLANLHTLYQQQLLQRQASPRRARTSSNSSDGVTVSGNQEQGKEQQVAAAEAAVVTKRSKVAQADADVVGPCANAADSLSRNSSCSSRSTCSSKSASRSNSMKAMGRSTSAKQAGSPAVQGAKLSLPLRVPSRKAVVSSPSAPPLPPGPVPKASLIRLQTTAAAGPAASLASSTSPRAQAEISTAADSETTVAAEAAQQEAANAHVIQEADGAVLEVPQAEAAHAAATGGETGATIQAEVAEAFATIEGAAACGRVGSWPSEQHVLPKTADGAGEQPSISGPTAAGINQLMAQPLGGSPDTDSQLQSSSSGAGASGVSASKLAKLKHGVRPMSFTEVFDAAASPATSEKCQTAAEDGGDSPTPVVKFVHQTVLSDSINRISIGTSIAACEGVSNRAADDGSRGPSDSPARSSLILLLPHSAANSMKAMQPGDTPSFSNLTTIEANADTANSNASTSAAQEAAYAEAAPGSQLLSQAAAGEGATVTPYGRHTVWPGWGGTDSWEGLTPTSNHGSMAHPGVVVQTAAEEQNSGHADAGVDALGPDAKYWLQQNPCFDMTPAGSTPGSACGSRNARMPFAAGAQVRIAETVLCGAGTPAGQAWVLVKLGKLAICVLNLLGVLLHAAVMQWASQCCIRTHCAMLCMFRLRRPPLQQQQQKLRWWSRCSQLTQLPFPPQWA